jgi:hypothetical protein
VKNITILLSALILNINLCFSQWIQTDGPYGQTNVSLLVPLDSLLIASASCGYFSKYHLTDRWNLNSGMTFTSYTRTGDSLYIGTEDNGTKIIDLNNLNNPPSNFSPISTIALSHSDSCIYGGTKTLGFFKFNDNGAYTIHNNGLPTDTVYTPWGTYYETYVGAIEITDNFIYAGTDEGLFRSDSSLNSWQDANNGLPIGYAVFIKNIRDTLYTAICEEVFYSQDNGNNWISLYTAPSNITSLSKLNNKLYVSTEENGIQFSDNNGTTWNEINTGLTDLEVNIVSTFDSTLICGTSRDGMFIYQNSTWLNNSEGLFCSWIRSMTIADNQLFANDAQHVFSLDASGDWTDVSPSVFYELFGSVASMNDTVFLSADYYSSPFILYSPNGGNSWQNLLGSVPSAGDDSYRMYCNDHKLYAYENDFMYFTGNLGSSWTSIGLPPQFCNAFNDFIVYNSVPFAAACSSGQVLKLDNNQDWILSNNGLPTNRDPEYLSSCDGAMFVYLFGAGMYASFNDGNNWGYRGNGLGTSWSLRDFEHYNYHLFEATDHGIYLTSNYGQDWLSCNSGLKNINAGSIKLLGDTLYVGTYGNGVWKQALDNIELSVPGYHHEPSDIKIIPNPASNYFRLDLDENLSGHLKVLDLTGRQLISEKINSNDLVSLEEIPEGIYIVVFISDHNLFTGILAIKK